MSATLSAPEAHPAAGRQLAIAIVSMPWTTARMPSIQAGLVTAIARAGGHSCRTIHPTLELSSRLGAEHYEFLCEHRGRMTGEWLFGIAAFGAEAVPDDEAYFEAFPQEIAMLSDAGLDRERLSRMRQDLLPEFVHDLAESRDWSEFDVVGFTSTFQQNVASLALARALKERHPELTTVFGGANMEAGMGAAYLEAFPWVDFAVSGEAEAAFPALLAGLGREEPPGPIPGVVMRRDDAVLTGGPSPLTRAMDDVPAPDYTDYFAEVARRGHPPVRRLFVESSRGCWWGAKHHCTFCGLNGTGMAYRAKSPDRFLAELADYAREFGITEFEATDNIADMHYVADFFGKLADEGVDYKFFYEVKSNLTYRQLRRLYQGGVRRVQPGIESLSTHVLGLMHKGSTMLQNVRFLKWCRYFGIRASWNLIAGFPGETVEDYEEQLRVLRLIPHLQPPSGVSRIWLERFSPYFADRLSYPVRDVRPEASYAHAYPGHVRLDDVAYFFDYRMDAVAPPEALYATEELIADWRDRYEAGSDSLTFRRTPDAVLVDDGRGSTVTTFTLDGLLGDLYLGCTETMASPARLADQLARTRPGRPPSVDEVRGALVALTDAGLMVNEDDLFLGLAVPVNPGWHWSEGKASRR